MKKISESERKKLILKEFWKLKSIEIALGLVGVFLIVWLPVKLVIWVSSFLNFGDVILNNNYDYFMAWLGGMFVLLILAIIIFVVIALGLIIYCLIENWIESNWKWAARRVSKKLEGKK